MRGAQRFLALSSAVAHFVLGLSVLLHLGATGNSAAWNILAEVWSNYGSPLAFLVIAALAVAGFFDIRFLRASLYAGSMVMGVWALALGAAWAFGYGPQPACVWIAWIGVLKWCTAEFGLRLERQTEAVQQLAAEVSETVRKSEAERGRGAGLVGSV